MLLGITRQAYYQYYWQLEQQSFEQELIVQQVIQIRTKHPRMGGRKLLELLQPFLLEHQIKIGRDALFDLLATNHLLIRRRKRKMQTTNSFHNFRRYPNLIKQFIPSKPNQLWVCDITYWKIETGYAYLHLITDAYSHKIVGYQLSSSLESIESIQALQMAIDSLGEVIYDLIHHSDRGIQYCSKEYVKLLLDNGIKISMTENGDPLENSVAERVNGILKEEYLDCYEVDNLSQALHLLQQVIQLYNEERPHMSISNLAPAYVHQNPSLKTTRLWKNYYSKNRTIVNQKQD